MPTLRILTNLAIPEARRASYWRTPRLAVARCSASPSPM